jgi:hypothetical protein
MTPVAPGAVFDCMVLLQAAVSKKGPAFDCLRLAQAGRVRIVLSADVLAEITDVLNRPELRRKFKSLTSDLMREDAHGPLSTVGFSRYVTVPCVDFPTRRFVLTRRSRNQRGKRITR